MATTNSATFTVSRTVASVAGDGSCVIELQYTNASTGNFVTRKILQIPADGSRVYDLSTGTVIATPAPAALVNAISTFASQIDSAISSGASGNKLNL